MARGTPSRRRGWTVLAAALALAAGLALLLLSPGSDDAEAPSGLDPRLVAEAPPQDPMLQGRVEPREPEDVPPRGRGVVTGLVIDGEGRPLAGIAVRAREEREPYRRDLLALPTPTDAARGQDPGVAGRSGADGRFRLTGLAVDVRTWIEAEVEAPLCTARALAVPKAEAPLPHVLLVVEEGVPLRGRVVDADGAGIAAMIDAELAFSEGHRVSGSGQWSVRGRTTDAEGRFLLRAVPARTVWLSAFAPNHGSHTHQPVRVPSAGEVVIALGVVPGAAVAGRVTDSKGAPIPRATVLARAEVQRVGMGFQETVARTTRTNDDGRYEVAHLPPGKLYRLRVVADGFLESDFIGYGLPLPAGVTTPFDVVLLRPGTVTGKVMDAAGQAIAGAEVFLGNGPSPGNRFASRLSPPARSDTDGTYRLDGIRPGRALVNASGKGLRVREPVSVDVAEGEAVTAPPLVMEPYESSPAPSPQEDTSAPTGVVEGRVTTPDGRPLPGFTVRATARGGTVRGIGTGPQGWYRFEDLATGTWSLIPARGQAVAGPPRDVAVRAGDVVADVTLVTHPAYVLAGTVVDDTGAPVAGVSVGARPAGARRHGTSRGGAGTYTDDTGRFEVLVLSDREWSFAVHGTTLAGTWPSGARDVRLVYTPRTTQAVTVVVRGGDGEVVPRAVVWVRWHSEGGGRSGTALTAGGGRFYGELPADVERVDVEVSRPCDAVGRALDWQPRTVEDVPLGEAPLDVVLNAGRTVAIRVLDAAGTPLPGVLVRVFRKREGGRWPMSNTSEWARSPMTDASGTCVIQGLPTGVELLAVGIFAGAHPPGVNPPPLTLGPRQSDVELRMHPAAHVTGIVQAGDGRPLAGVHVQAHLDGSSRARWAVSGFQAPASPWRGWRTTTNADGHFHLAGVPAGATLALSATGANFLPIRRAGVPADARHVVLALEEGLFLTGRVEGAQPWASASSLSIGVSPANAPSATRVRARLDAAGRFRLGPLPGGDWRIAVTADGTEIATQRASTPSSDLEFRLPDLHVLTVQLLGDDVGEFVVYVTAADGSSMSRSTPPSGSVSFSLTDDETRRVVATRDGDERIGVAESARASAGPLRLELSVGLTIAGRIEGLAPGAAERVEILLTGAGVARYASCDAGGAFRLPGLLPGRYRLTVWGEELGGRIPAVEAIEAGTTDLVLRVE